MIDALSGRGLVLGLVLLLAGGFAASAGGLDGDDDHETAHRALRQGQTKPLVDILAVVEERIGGDVVGVEFEGESGRYVYELKIVAPDGRLREVLVDALTGEILSGEHD